MGRTAVARTIQAPVAVVFDTVAHIHNFREAVPHIVRVEFLSETRRGVGTRFRETRLMGKREATVDLEVTEYVENERIRIVSDTHGTVWDTVFSMTAVPGGTELTMVMDANAYRIMARLMNVLIKGMLQKALARDLDAVKEYCEGLASASAWPASLSPERDAG